jgi:hypothetical protein
MAAQGPSPNSTSSILNSTLAPNSPLIGIFLTDIQIIYSLDFTDFIPKGLRGGS